MDEEFEKYCTVFEYYTTRRLHQYFFVFLQSVSRQIGQKKSQQTLLQLTMDLIIKGTSGGSFVVMASYAPVPFSFYLQQDKKKQPKKQKPQTLFYSIALLSTSRREMSMPSLQFQIMLFSNVPFPQGWVFLKFEDLHFHTIFGKSSYLRKLTKDFQNYFQSHSNKGNFMGSIQCQAILT